MTVPDDSELLKAPPFGCEGGCSRVVPCTVTLLVPEPQGALSTVTTTAVEAIFLVIWGTLVIGMIDNFLRPKLVGGRTRLHELLIFFAVLGGLQVFGVLGIVLGPVVLALAMSLIEVFRAADSAAEEPGHV